MANDQLEHKIPDRPSDKERRDDLHPLLAALLEEGEGRQNSVSWVKG